MARSPLSGGGVSRVDLARVALRAALEAARKNGGGGVAYGEGEAAVCPTAACHFIGHALAGRINEA